MTGRISLLVSRDLATLIEAARGLDREVRKQLRAHTKRVAAPAWTEEVNAHVHSHLQEMVLGRTARVAVSDTNVMLKTATVGRVRGMPTSVIAPGAEFGANASTVVDTTSVKGTRYRRRLGNAFGPHTPKGNVFFPSVDKTIPRIAALWFQTAYRTVAEQFEKAGA